MNRIRYALLGVFAVLACAAGYSAVTLLHDHQSDGKGGFLSTAALNAGTLGIARGGTNSTATPTAGAVVYGNGTSYAFSSTTGAAGDCLKSGGTGTPTWGSCAAGGGYATIQDEGTPLTQRTTLNFTGAGVTCTDNGGTSTTDCSIPGGGAVGPTGAIQYSANGLGTMAGYSDFSVTPSTGDFSFGRSGYGATVAIGTNGATQEGRLSLLQPLWGSTNGQATFHVASTYTEGALLASTGSHFARAMTTTVVSSSYNATLFGDVGRFDATGHRGQFVLQTVSDNFGSNTGTAAELALRGSSVSGYMTTLRHDGTNTFSLATSSATIAFSNPTYSSTNFTWDFTTGVLSAPSVSSNLANAVPGAVYYGGSSLGAWSGTATAGSCLQSNGTGAPTWGTCGSNHNLISATHPDTTGTATNGALLAYASGAWGPTSTAAAPSTTTTFRLTAQGTGTPTWTDQGFWSMKTTSNTTTTSTAALNIPALTVTIPSSTYLLFFCHLAQTGTATGGARATIVASSAPTLITYALRRATTSLTTDTYQSASASGTLSTTCTSGCNTASMPTIIQGTILTNAATTISVAHASSSSSQTITTSAGSGCVFFKP